MQVLQSATRQTRTALYIVSTFSTLYGIEAITVGDDGLLRIPLLGLDVEGWIIQPMLQAWLVYLTLSYFIELRSDGLRNENSGPDDHRTHWYLIVARSLLKPEVQSARRHWNERRGDFIRVSVLDMIAPAASAVVSSLTLWL